MATTSTNKQPLLVDNVLHNVVDLNNAIVSDINLWATNPGLHNSAAILIRGNGSDGAIVEDIYCIRRDTEEYTMLFFLSGEEDYLRPGSSSCVGRFHLSAGGGIGDVEHYYDMPYVLAPVPAVGTIAGGQEIALKYKALYVPRGMSLWAGRLNTANNVVTTAPYVGVQGGWY